MSCANEQPRVMLWTTSRSCSTAVLRSITNVKGGVFYYEPYGCAFYHGPERDLKSAPHLPSSTDPAAPGADMSYDSSINTFAWVKQTLEAGHKNASLVFAKDLAYSLQGKLLEEYLPRGYYHSFLIRNPYKVIPSWRICNKKFRPPGPPMDESAMEKWNDIQIGKHAGYKELLELYEHVVGNLDSVPFVMDADDLLANPEALMTAYCKAIGVPFSKKLLEWKDGLPMNTNWISCRDQLGCFSLAHHMNVRNSRGFLKREELTLTTNSAEATDPKVLEIIQRCLPYYQKLYGYRFTR